MRVLITGGAGRLGIKACRAFLENGFEVRIFDLRSERNLGRVKELRGKVETVWGDIVQRESVRQALQDVDSVVHMAGVLPPITDEQPEIAHAVNVEGTRTLLEVIREKGGKVPIVYTSSIVVFGATPEATEPISVDKNPVNPEEVYAETKVKAENLIKESGVDYVILRMTAAFDLDASAIKLMFRLPLTNRIEFCHPDDTIQAIVNAVRHFDAAKGSTLMIAGGPDQRMLYRDMLGGALGVLGLPLPPSGKFSQQPYCTDWYDTSRAQELLQFQRKTFEDFCQDLSAEFSKKYSPLFVPFMRYFIGPVFGRVIVRLM